MKKKHELPNGTILEVGKKYGSENWKGYIEVKYLGESNFVFTTGGDGQEPIENTSDYSHANAVWDIQPYTEPNKKIKVAKYAYFDVGVCSWKESKDFYKSDEEFKNIAERKTYTRLDYTEIEVDEY